MPKKPNETCLEMKEHMEEFFSVKIRGVILASHRHRFVQPVIDEDDDEEYEISSVVGLNSEHAVVEWKDFFNLGYTSLDCSPDGVDAREVIAKATLFWVCYDLLIMIQIGKEMENDMTGAAKSSLDMFLHGRQGYDNNHTKSCTHVKEELELLMEYTGLVVDHSL